MENLQVAQDVRQEADERGYESAFGGRYPPAAPRAMTKTGHRSGYGGPVEWHAATPIRPARQKTTIQQARREPIDPIVVIFWTGLAVELSLPWGIIWLSDIFFFDIPAWSRWVVFGLPAALSLLAVLLFWAFRKLSKQPFRAWIPGHQACWCGSGR